MTTLFLSNALLPDGWATGVRLRLAGGVIVTVERGVAVAADEERHAIGVPGLTNLHSHGFQRGMAGLSEVRGPATDSFWSWREVMYSFLGVITPDDVEALTAQAYVEMLEGGFTRVGEFHYLHNDPGGRPYSDPAEMAARIAAAAGQTGIGLTLLPSFYAQGGFGDVPPTPGQRRFVTGLDGFARLHEASRRALAGLDGTAIGIAPHSLRAVTAGQLAALLALHPDGPVHIHVAEQVREVEDSLAWSGARPVQWLLDHAEIGPRWCLVHATHVDPEEVRRLADAGAVVALCPVTEANLGDGVFPGPAWAAAGGCYGIGSDSNVRVDAAGELRLLEEAQRLHRRGRNLMTGEAAGTSTGRTLFDAAVRSAAALGGPQRAGLQPGAPASLVTLRADHPSLVARRGDAWLDGWIFGAAHGVVDCVWAGGRQLVADGRHVARAAVASRYAAALEGLLAA